MAAPSNITDIKAAQASINKYFGGTLKVDGVWGPKTQAAWDAAQAQKAGATQSNTPTAKSITPVVTNTPVSSAETTAGLGQTINASAPTTGNAQVNAILSTMTQNSAAWKTATTQPQKDQLTSANQTLASQLSGLGIQATRNTSGVWNVLDYSGSTELQGTVSATLAGQTVNMPVIGGASLGTVTFMPDPIMQPQQYIALSPDEMYKSIMSSATNVGAIFDTIQKLSQQALTAGNVDIAAAIKVYTDQIEKSLGGMQSKYDEMYADGPNDPGLQSALQLMREGANETRTQMMEELNARGLSRSGLLVKAEERFVKGAASQEAQLIGQFMSQMYQTYMDSMTNIMNQRVGYLSQMGQLQGQAAIQSATNRVSAITSTMGALTDIGNTMANMHTAAWNTAYDAYNDQMNYNETARHNYTSEQETRRGNMSNENIDAAGVYGGLNQNNLNYQENVRSNVKGEQQADLKISQDFEVALQSLGIQNRELVEKVRSNKASEGLTRQQIAQTGAKYRQDAAVQQQQLAIDYARLGLDSEKAELDARFTQAKIDDIPTQNALTRMELDIKESELSGNQWKTDVAKAEIMATHLLSTQTTLKSFVDSVKSGDTDINTAIQDFQTMYPALGINSKLHNFSAEMSMYQDAKKELNALVTQNNTVTARNQNKWYSFNKWNTTVNPSWPSWVNQESWTPNK